MFDETNGAMSCLQCERLLVTFMSEIYCEDELPVKVALLSIIFMGLLLHASQVMPCHQIRFSLSMRDYAFVTALVR